MNRKHAGSKVLEPQNTGLDFYSQAGWILFALSLSEAETGRSLADP